MRGDQSTHRPYTLDDQPLLPTWEWLLHGAPTRSLVRHFRCPKLSNMEHSSGEALPTMPGPSEVLRPFVIPAKEVWKQPRVRAELSVAAGAGPAATVRITVRGEGPRVARAEGEGGCQSM